MWTAPPSREHVGTTHIGRGSACTGEDRVGQPLGSELIALCDQLRGVAEIDRVRGKAGTRRQHVHLSLSHGLITPAGRSENLSERVVSER
jgi:hypothetical protein